jgi:hypothetical protein
MSSVSSFLLAISLLRTQLPSILRNLSAACENLRSELNLFHFIPGHKIE